MFEMKKINFKSLAFHLLVPLMLFFIISMLMPDYDDYYVGLIKPVPELPRIALIAVWGLMYLLIGLGAYTLERTEDGESDNAKAGAFRSYFWMLLINLFWFPVVFGLRLFILGWIWTLGLVLLAYISYRKANKVNKNSGYLFLPYLVWLLYLLYFTFGLWALNSGLF